MDDVVTITSRAMRSHRCGVSAARGKQVPAQLEIEFCTQRHTVPHSDAGMRKDTYGRRHVKAHKD